MNTARISPLFGAAALLAVLTGCGNPADNVTPAQVGDAPGDAMPAAEESMAGTPLPILETSTIGFVGSKVTGSHEGGFRTFTGSLAVAEGRLVASGSRVEIDMNSTWSDNDRLTGHLKSPDFFDAETYPTATFVFTDVSDGSDGTTITGNLTLHGATKQISFPADVKTIDNQIKLSAEFYLKRFDFDIVYPGRADDLIRDEVVIRLDVAAEA